jgi:hypothetical protein
MIASEMTDRKAMAIKSQFLENVKQHLRSHEGYEQKWTALITRTELSRCFRGCDPRPHALRQHSRDPDGDPYETGHVSKG